MMMNTAPFKALFNAHYSKDISRKVHTAYLTQAQKGRFTGCVAPVGYLKDPEDNVWLDSMFIVQTSEAKHHINVKVDMDELDLTSAEAKATYKEIQDWVQEKYGFHVTNLNIAQVKQKHGIIERENYNKPKSEDSKQPGCPEEKVEAIEDALRYFQMI